MKKRIPTGKALGRRITAVVLGLWLVFTGLLTLITANGIYSRFLYFGSDYSRMYQPDHYYANQVSSDQPGFRESNILFWLWNQRTASFGEGWHGFEEPAFSPLSSEAPEYSRAMLLTDESGNELFSSRDYLFFAYADEESWLRGDGDIAGFTYFPMEDRERYAGLMDYFHDSALGTLHMWGKGTGWCLRFTGIPEGVRLQPVKIEFGILDYSKLPLGVSNWEQSMNLCDQKGYVSWETVYEASQQLPGEPVVLYAENADMFLYREDGTLLTELRAWKGAEDRQRFSGDILRCTVFSTAEGDHGRVWAAVSCSPLWEAVKALRYVYMVTLAGCVLLLLLLLGSIRRNLTQPLKRVRNAIDYRHTSRSLTRPSRWQEPELLEAHIPQTNEELARLHAENARLTTALEFARDAEEKRRTMVSNITHELKTPLAIIHSYAEGLLEDIAREQRERYLQIILEEAERMDALVLEMLDHSRLEAGKVRLTLSAVSLTELTREVFEKLAPALQAKELQLQLDFPESVTVTADEARLEQVIRNFATNAIKYTPTAGVIRVGVYRFGSEALFSVENSCQPLSQEVIAHIWDSFYRADDSRSGREGTGLGLSIAKSILSLHRGTCEARATEGGMEFRFRLPL